MDELKIAERVVKRLSSGFNAGRLVSRVVSDVLSEVEKADTFDKASIIWEVRKGIDKSLKKAEQQYAAEL